MPSKVKTWFVQRDRLFQLTIYKTHVSFSGVTKGIIHKS